MPSRYRAAGPFISTLFTATAIFLFLLSACGKQQDPDSAKRSIVPFTNYVETGDLQDIRKHDVIRFVNLSGPVEDLLPRDSIVTLGNVDLANKLAARLKLEPKWIQAASPREAIELVRAGKADVVAHYITDTKGRRELVDFTVPLMQTSHRLVTTSKGPDISDPAKLRNVELLVQTGSTYEATAQQLVQQYPEANLTILEVQHYDDRDALIDMMNEKTNRVAILDGHIAEDLHTYRKDIRIGASVSKEENIAWAVRKDSERLLATINNFLTRNLVQVPENRIADWKKIKKSGVIRFLTYNRPSVYYVWKGVLMGFDYDLAKAFADKHKLQLQVIVVPYDETLIDWLKAGRGDFAGAVKNITQERKDRGIVFTTSYRETPEQVVSNRRDPVIKKVQDLAGRTLTIRAFSPFIATARVIEKSGIDVEVEIAPPDQSIAEIISMIADGDLDATIVDRDDVLMAASVQPELLPGTLVSDPRPQGWMLMPQNWELLKKLNAFLKQYRKTKQYQQKIAAYFEPNKRFTQRVAARIIPGKDLSPYDLLVKGSSLDYGFDWRLVVAQMWHESNFNPDAVSPVGAQGLMQVMPVTAEEMGFPPPLFEPERNIPAGVKYLNWVRDRFEPTLPAVDRLWFTLASYNAGYGHLLDARRLAVELGLDPDVWFGNVEVAMLKLSEPKYYKNARYGYVRGAEPVQYVRKISDLYKAYTEVASGDISVRPPMRKKIPEETADSNKDGAETSTSEE
ncbi:transporter substrate-binding domain-containing protein [Microbulbifer litoralis]|uniref:transporter substrate-binding domain-containing protein n=1 Tax=Microbulbifer litoralis TaxID=2933965 RepID=UPI002027A046|nr:transporter substrate-binding domain-containing protein [Microbulbifer sp. GX H0434]